MEATTAPAAVVGGEGTMNKRPEPIILAVVLLTLALAVGAMAFWWPSLPEITGVSDTKLNGLNATLLQEDQLSADLAPWSAPTAWPEANHQLFISDEYLFWADLYPSGKYITKNTKDARTPSGVLISWYRKYGIDITDSNVDREDPDHDGFSNIVEFKNGAKSAFDCDGTKSCNPLDPQSHPSYLSRLRLQKFETRPFHMEFRGYEQLNGEYEFEIHLTDVEDSMQPGLKKTGDQLGYEGYSIGAFHQKMVTQVDAATGLPTQMDVSTLDLVKPSIGFTITLTLNKETDSPEYTADFVCLMPSEVNKVIKVARGKTFSPPYMNGTVFLVISADANGAKVKDAKTGEEIEIPTLDPKELDEMPVDAAAKTTTGGTQTPP